MGGRYGGDIWGRRSGSSVGWRPPRLPNDDRAKAFHKTRGGRPSESGATGT